MLQGFPFKLQLNWNNSQAKDISSVAILMQSISLIWIYPQFVFLLSGQVKIFAYFTTIFPKLRAFSFCMLSSKIITIKKNMNTNLNTILHTNTNPQTSNIFPYFLNSILKFLGQNIIYIPVRPWRYISKLKYFFYKSIKGQAFYV